ncbi:MAG: glycosyl hydrolase, partial [Bacteroidetes bacterium]
MIPIDTQLTPAGLRPALAHFWEVSAAKLALIRADYDPWQGSPVYTRAGRYTTRGWTDWTQGFAYGSEILQYDATGDPACLQAGREATRTHMAAHVGHFGVHDHGFNNVSTYGNLLRLMREGRIPENPWERDFYELALKLSGAVQARRWTPLPEGGFIHSFNGPHSLFVDTIRTLRVLMLSHALGHALQGEQDQQVSLLARAVQHAEATARYSIYYGEGRDRYDTWGRTAHESIFNPVSGAYRCPNSQQGYSGFTTWTRGLAWAMLGFAEQLEFLGHLPAEEWAAVGGKDALAATWRRAAEATCDFYLTHTPTDGVPYWDTGAPGLVHLGDYLDHPADPFNPYEPVDSSAAAIAAQGLLRFG